MSETITLPTHIGFILDGNRRWAKQNNLSINEGHRIGAEVFKKIALHGFDRGIKNISAYIFSTENWQRTEQETGFLMQLAIKAVEQYLDEFHDRGIKVIILGRKKGLRKKVLDSMLKTEEKTKNNTGGTLALCFNYGGREEIIDAAQRLTTKNLEITEKNFSKSMYHSEVPDLDLIIRTSGEKRLSNFMLWRAAYAEFMFVQKHWPEYTDDDLDVAINEYSARHRSFGK